MARRSGFKGAAESVKAGNFGEAVDTIGSYTSDEDLTADIVDGVKLGIGRRMFGKLPIIQTRKFRMTVF